MPHRQTLDRFAAGEPAPARLKRLLLGGAALAFAIGLPLAAQAQAQAQPEAQAAPPPAADAQSEIDELKAEVATLAAQVQDLKRSQIAQIQTLATVQNSVPAPPAVNTSLDGGKLVISSADKQFTFAPRALLQFDAADYDQAEPGPFATDLRRDGAAVGSPSVDMTHARDLKDGDVFRRARLGFEGTAYGDFSYRMLFDFGGSGVENSGQLYEGWAQYAGLKPFAVRVGAFRPSEGLEDQTTPSDLMFLDRPGSTDTAGGLAASDTRTAVQVFGYGDRWFASADVTGRAIGVISTGTASATAQSYGDQLGFVGRVGFTPLKGDDWRLYVGAHGSYVSEPPNASGPSTAVTGVTPISSRVIAFNDTPEMRVDGTKLVNTGNIDAKDAGTEGLEFAVQKQNLFLQAEYENMFVDRSDIHSSPSFSGWYVEGSWFVTGEARRYSASAASFGLPVVAHPFNPRSGQWGAVELAVRYSDLDLNYDAGAARTLPTVDAVRGGDQKIFTAGVNWYLNSLFRLTGEYQHVTIDRLSPCTTATATSCSTVWLTPAGAQIGQSYDAFAFRSQVSF